MGKKSEWSTLMPFLCSSPRTTPRKVRDDRGRLQKLFLDYICKRVTQDNICNSWIFLQLPPSTYYFLFRRRDGWLPIYTKQFVPSAPVLFSFAAFPFIIKHKHKKVHKMVSNYVWCWNYLKAFLVYECPLSFVIVWGTLGSFLERASS